MTESYLSSFELARLGGLNAGRYPAWGTEQVADAATAAPWSPTAGWSVAGSALALVAVDLAVADTATQGARAMYIGVVGAVAAGSYSITVDSETYAYTADGSEDVATILGELLTDIVSTGTHSVQRIDTDGDGETDELRIWRIDGAAIPTEASITPNLSAVRDATEATVRVWGLAAGSTRWRRLGSQDLDELAASYLDLWRTGAMDRIALQVVVTDGRVRLNVATCGVTSEDAVAESALVVIA